MDRRNFLKSSAAVTGGLLLPSTSHAKDPTLDLGWIPSPSTTSKFIRRSRRPYVHQHRIAGTGAGRKVYLHKFLEQALNGEVIPHFQDLGDCVGQAYGMGVDLLQSTQIFLKGLAEEFIAKVSTEVAYAGSRYEIGYQRYGVSRLLRGEGSHGLWCAEFLRDFGVLHRGVYGNYDLTKYNPRLARLWGRKGVPDELEPRIKEHPVRSFTLCQNYEDVRDAIANGYPVICCSSVGFNNNPDICNKCNPNGRDKEGFLNPCCEWMHAMVFAGVDDASPRKGVVCLNSAGADWLRIQNTIKDLPDWAFKIDARVVDRMCSEGDTIAISNYVGHPRQNDLDLSDYLF